MLLKCEIKDLLTVRCPVYMRDSVIDRTDRNIFSFLLEDDARIRTIPFPTRRPTFNEVKRVHQELSSVQVLGKSRHVTLCLEE